MRDVCRDLSTIQSEGSTNIIGLYVMCNVSAQLLLRLIVWISFVYTLLICYAF